MDTPVVNENGISTRKLNEMQNNLQSHKSRKQSIDERITHLQKEIRSLICQDAHYDTIGEAEVELNSLITEGAWVEKEIVRLSLQIDEIRTHQGFIDDNLRASTTDNSKTIRVRTERLKTSCVTVTVCEIP
jgi:chromosome segregation ATPase